MAPEAHFCCVPSIHVTPPGILRQGRFTTKTTSSLPPRRQYRTLMKVTAAFAGLIGAASYFLNGRQLPPLTDGAYLRKLKGERAAGYGYEGMIAWLNAETSGLPAEERQRRLAVGKSVWPRCVTQRMSAIQCKELIDQEILSFNTDTDRFVRTIIVGKRNENDPLSNAVVLLMDDNDRVKGRDGDGLVRYDFEWSGSGNEATRYQQRKIPPIVATEVKEEPTLDSVEIRIVPLRVLGASTYDAINLYSTAPISGGVETLGAETNTAEGEAKLQAALAETATIEQSGKRSIGPFDCSGMTGHSCCLMIKHKVRDSDRKGRAIQCYLDYHEDTEKHKALLNARGKKVFIFENHKGMISKEPKIVGDWPQGIADSNPDFHDWIQDGGGLSTGQMRLIHGPDWNPPGQGPI